MSSKVCAICGNGQILRVATTVEYLVFIENGRLKFRAQISLVKDLIEWDDPLSTDKDAYLKYECGICGNRLFVSPEERRKRTPLTRKDQNMGVTLDKIRKRPVCLNCNNKRRFQLLWRHGIWQVHKEGGYLVVTKIRNKDGRNLTNESAIRAAESFLNDDESEVQAICMDCGSKTLKMERIPQEGDEFSQIDYDRSLNSQTRY